MPRPGEDRSDGGGAAQFNNIGPVPLSRFGPVPLSRFRFFEDGEGLWRVEVTGNNLGGLHRDLTLGRRESIRVGDSVTAIEIKAWTPPGKVASR